MATADSKRSRKPNFKQEELSVLVDEVEKKTNLESFLIRLAMKEKKNFGFPSQPSVVQ